jgi:hypothetical protein
VTIGLQRTDRSITLRNGACPYVATAPVDRHLHILDATNQSDRTVEPQTVATHRQPVVDHSHTTTSILTGMSLYPCAGSWSTRTFAPWRRVISELVQHDDAERHGEHRPCASTVRPQRRRNSRVSDFLVGCDGAGGAPGTSKLSWSS